ncbi:outer membrane beta-barrel protein [Fluoribacter gormanii]|uniref:Outer membrane protein beta-barrel domain-containing protein n=1 Tax=Fluoribacter gormanii TaxID=464 RepID=A0A377GM99_9GAMM|nr:outer membrane beta-barrel protein [Fluoribacter gormanii]KTD05538.1 hypothetical protein Lgor_0023 [Fluoribacter gormanii]MCW8442678.1 outer membrane beta-barrel protein [Fluoribacter gormanii]MCW8471153.1 outer membrane beta-barrel protein [Fluoribacter gormanii]SIQ70290.1 Outer membrane protein beta-barrel domain-containing protein [Fluoribacter gormanii]STO25713.1 Uncharacterised protein [Fluoribacter gormanii]
MRQIIKFGFILGLVTSSSAFSAEPVQGLYLGLLGQVSHATNLDLNFSLTQLPNLGTIGTVQLGPVGGGIGASLGYKIQNFRLEGEFLFNINNYGQLNAGSCTLISPAVLGPEGTCPPEVVDVGLGFNGYTIGLYGFFNAFYDFMSSDPNVNFVPYLGVGVGGADLLNHAVFQSNNQCISLGTCSPIVNESFDKSHFGFAAQGILGFNYYIDDFTTIGLDFRYVSTFNLSKNNSTSSTTNSSNSAFGISTINLTGNFALEKAS